MTRVTLLGVLLVLLCWPVLAPLAPSASQASSTQDINDRYTRQLLGQVAGHESEPASQVFKNVQLQWLKETNAATLVEIMNGGYAKALGVTCTHCHVEGDFASDEKREKKAAREMAAMHWAINGQLRNMAYLTLAPDRRSINCHTCHRGAIDPTAP